jgi:hypothetical protein
MQNVKKKTELPLPIDDMNIYIENLKEQKKLMKLKCSYINLQDTKLIYKNESFYHTPAMNKWNLKLKT